MHSATVSSNDRSCSNSEQNGASRRTSKWADFVEKVRVLTRPNFFSAVGAVFRFGRRGGLIIHLRLNGASSKSICGGNKRQSKMSLVFRQICSDYRLATFSTESAHKQTIAPFTPK